jgi:uncharacterized OB-fold protein
MRPVEVPPPDETTAGWWDATREHRLTVQSCDACSGVQHPPRALCTHCGRTGTLGLRPATGRGVVDTYTVVHRASVPDLEVPYVIARVRLDEGVVLLTRLEGRDDGDAWAIDDPVAVDWVGLADGRALPVFRPAPDPAQP